MSGYLQLYQTHRCDLLEEYRDHKHNMDSYEWMVYTTWQLSFDHLKTHAAQAATVLQQCAFLHHNGISQAIFQNAAANINLPFADQKSNSLSNAKDFLGEFLMSEAWDTQKFLEVLSEIRSYSLIDFDDKTQMYSIHPLLHDWIRTTVSDGEATRTSAQYILLMSVSSKFASEDYSFRRTLLPHIDAAIEGGTSTGSDLTARLGRVHSEGGRWKKAKELDVLMETMGRYQLALLTAHDRPFDRLSNLCLDGQIKDQSMHVVASGGYADIWTGSLGCHKVAIKVMRAFSSTGTAIEREKITKVCDIPYLSRWLANVCFSVSGGNMLHGQDSLIQTYWNV